jgi:acyl-CoA thioester hydrolase
MNSPEIFEHRFQVEADDIDGLGHVNNVVYLRYAQDAAIAHWYAAVPGEHGEKLAWVVRRHEIDYLKPAIEHDELIARTWIGEVSGATLERFIEIVRSNDGSVLAKVRSVWVALDAQSMRPRRVSRTLIELFTGLPASRHPGREGERRAISRREDSEH